MNIVKTLFKGVHTIAIWVLLFMFGWVVINAAQLEISYFEKYENSHASVVREHDRQLLAHECLRSQQNWARAGSALQHAYFKQQENMDNLVNLLESQNKDILFFMTTLENLYPGVNQEVINEMNKEPTPAERIEEK